MQWPATMLVLAGLAIGVVVFEAGAILMSTALCVEGRLIKPRGDRTKRGRTATNVGAMGGAAGSSAATAASGTSGGSGGGAGSVGGGPGWSTDK